MNNAALIVIAVLLAGCSSTPTDLETKTAPAVQAYSENYQEIFRRVSNTARRCLSGNAGGYSSFDVDAQIYSDLGFGEVTQSLVNVGARNYYVSAKIERVDEGSRMTVHTGNTLAAAKLKNSMFRWAAGSDGC